MTEHTKEPWTSGRYTGASGEDGPVRVWNAAGRVVCDLPATLSGFDCARRIVACVNACAGIPTEALADGFLTRAVEHYAQAVEQQGMTEDGETVMSLRGEE